MGGFGPPDFYLGGDMNTQTAWQNLWNTLGQIQLNRQDRMTLEGGLNLLYEKAKELEDIKAEEKDGGTDIGVLDPGPSTPSS